MIWIGLVIGLVIGALFGLLAASLCQMAGRDQDRDDALARCRIALSIARARARVIADMIQDEDYVTARHCAKSMYGLGEDG